MGAANSFITSIEISRDSMLQVLKEFHKFEKDSARDSGPCCKLNFVDAKFFHITGNTLTHIWVLKLKKASLCLAVRKFLHPHLSNAGVTHLSGSKGLTPYFEKKMIEEIA